MAAAPVADRPLLARDAAVAELASTVAAARNN
jgi:hypothetical protein